MLLDTQLNLQDLPESIGKLQSGVYFAQITKAEICVSKANINNEYIKICWEVIGDNGGMVYQNINFKNVNKTAEQLGLIMLRKIMSIGNVLTLRDTDELIGIMADIVVEHENPNEKNNFIESSNVKDVKHHSGTPTPISGFAQTTQQRQTMGQNTAMNSFITTMANKQPQVAPMSTTPNTFDPNVKITPRVEVQQTVREQVQTPQPINFGPESFVGDDFPTLESHMKA